MANSNGTRTVQLDNGLAIRIKLIATKRDINIKDVLDEAIKEYLSIHEGE